MSKEKEVIKEIHHIYHYYPIGYQKMMYPYPWHSILPPPTWEPSWYYEPHNYTWEPSWYYEPHNYTWNIKTHTR